MLVKMLRVLSRISQNSIKKWCFLDTFSNEFYLDRRRNVESTQKNCIDSISYSMAFKSPTFTKLTLVEHFYL
jgi:hypothetical protein